MSNYIPYIEQLLKIANDNGNEKAVNVAKFLKHRIENPDSYVVCLGESCSGKSTIINEIIGKDILPVSGVPSTATITEICLDNECKEDSFFAINKNATMEAIDKDTFCKLVLNPDNQLERLRLVSHSDKNWSGIRIFDTPGYGSLVAEHEEVLMKFLPECDAIMYTVSYKIGIQDEDYVFIQSMSELTRCGIPFCLIINRCPVGIKEDDVRIDEIKNYVKGLLEITEISIVLVESFGKEVDSYNAIDKIQSFILNTVKSETRLIELNEAFRGYVCDLCEMIESDIDKKINFASLEKEEAQILIDSTKEYISSLRKAKSEIVDPGFNRIIENFSKQVDLCSENLKRSCVEEVNKQNTFEKKETQIFIKQFLLKYHGQKQAEELQFYLEKELLALDEEINNYLNKAVVKIENDLKIRNVSEAAKTGFDLLKRGGQEALGKGLVGYFAKFGGQGGAGAGVANAASHFLKQFGDFFGTSFSLETHNSVKHLLKEVGLTSSKSLAVVAVVVVDAIAEIIDLSTWKVLLAKSLGKAAKDWAKDVKTMTNKDLEKLRHENISNLEELACMAEEELIPLTQEELVDIEYLQMNKEIVAGIRRSVMA